MTKAHPLKASMIVRLDSFKVKLTSFRLESVDDESLGPKVPYLNVIG